MLFVSVICGLFFFTNFSAEAKLGKGRRQRDFENAAEDINQTTKNVQNETSKSENYIKKSELDELVRLKSQYVVKNYIDEFETHYAISFMPDWTKMNKSISPIRQNIDIRRQKWEYILDKAKGTLFIDRLNSELKKANIDRAEFCDDIAETYSILSDNSYVIGKASGGCDPLQKNSIVAFMSAISNLKLDARDNEETVQIPKSLYMELIRRDAQAVSEKRHYEEEKRIWKDRIKSLKTVYRQRVREARGRDGGKVDSNINSGSY